MAENRATPLCIGIILDGNRRWAKERGLHKLEGHRVGLLDTLKNTIKAVKARGIKNLAVFLFSTENWGREEAEVTYLMDLFREQWEDQLRDLAKEGVRVRFAGQRGRFSLDLQAAMTRMEEESKHNSELTLWACMSYGGRAEIVDAAQKACAAGEGITEETLNKHMWTGEMPNVDVFIRTSGEQRLSGFLTWKSTYSELFFTDTKWPDFNEAELDRILAEYAQRERRHGK